MSRSGFEAGRTRHNVRATTHAPPHTRPRCTRHSALCCRPVAAGSQPDTCCHLLLPVLRVPLRAAASAPSPAAAASFASSRSSVPCLPFRHPLSAASIPRRASRPAPVSQRCARCLAQPTPLLLLLLSFKMTTYYATQSTSAFIASFAQSSPQLTSGPASNSASVSDPSAIAGSAHNSSSIPNKLDLTIHSTPKTLTTSNFSLSHSTSNSTPAASSLSASTLSCSPNTASATGYGLDPNANPSLSLNINFPPNPYSTPTPMVANSTSSPTIPNSASSASSAHSFNSP